MKQCAACGREYDNTMSFCLDDGAELLYGPAPADEPATAILHETVPNEAATRAQINPTAGKYVLPTGAGEAKRATGFDKRLLTVPLLLGVLAIGGFFGYRYFVPARANQINSIAVLPFENRSTDPDSEYLSDGLAESLIYRLSQIPNLNVSPRSSVFRYKGQNVDAEKVGAELGVDAVMSGRLVQRGESLTVSVDLVDVRNKKTIWGEQFQRKMSDLLAIQREIATAVTEKLQLKLSGDDAKGVSKRYTNDNEAYQSYLKGRFYWEKRDGENIRKAIDHFKTAADKDPQFALAYVGLADCYALLQEYAGTQTSESLPQAMAYARRALEIDDSLAEAHATLGLVSHMSWNWADAEKSYKKAIELNPNYPTALHWYSLFFRYMGRPEEALPLIKRAQQLDPLSLIISANVVENHLALGDVNSAFDEAKKLVEMDPNNWGPHHRLALVYLKMGNSSDALAEFRKAVELSKRSSFSLGFYGYALGVNGDRQDALRIAKELEQRYAEQTAGGVNVAGVYAGLGDKERAFVWLEKDFQTRSSALPELNDVVALQPLHDDPRFKDLLRRMGLPE